MNRSSVGFIRLGDVDGGQRGTSDAQFPGAAATRARRNTVRPSAVAPAQPTIRNLKAGGSPGSTSCASGTAIAMPRSLFVRMLDGVHRHEQHQDEPEQQDAHRR
jgi:hypothetical protein